MKYRPVVKEVMSFKDNSYLELWRPFCSVEQKLLCHFGKGHYEEQFSEIVLNLDQWFRMICRLKYFLSGALAALVFSGAEPLCNFERGHHGEHTKFGPVVQEEMSLKEKVYGRWKTHDGRRS